MKRDQKVDVRMTADEKNALLGLAMKHQTTPSNLIRAMLGKVLPKDFEPGEVSLEKRPRKDKAMYVTVDAVEAQKIRGRAKDEGTTAPSWIRKIIRTVLFKEHNLNPGEVNALRESNRELGHLGRNINQIAHELHLSMNASDQITAEKLDDLFLQISEHRAKVVKLLNANWGRMSADSNSYTQSE